MDLKQYYKKIRETEEQLSEEYPLLSSLETPDGGKVGRLSEVSRAFAAKMIVEGRARLATEAEIGEYRDRQAAAIRAAEKADLARRVQIVIADSTADGPATGKKGNQLQGGK